MSGRSLTKTVLAACAAATLAACASTSLQSTWKDPAAAPLNLKGKKVAALVVSPEEALRYAAEDEAAREITAHGAVGVPAYTLLPQAQVHDKERARAIFEKEGIEAVVVLRAVAKEKELSGSFSSIPSYGSFWGPGFWGGGWGWGDGYLRTDTILVVETLVYSLPQNKLVWASQSKTLNPTQVGSFIRELGKTIGTEMEKQGLL
ncbi:MAG TPA: hypothetical protein VFM88_02340 [Vicinamibacteria bacterium]|nr:hypothetical protein [Vicinamibacteria bacterium]